MKKRLTIVTIILVCVVTYLSVIYFNRVPAYCEAYNNIFTHADQNECYVKFAQGLYVQLSATMKYWFWCITH